MGAMRVTGALLAAAALTLSGCSKGGEPAAQPPPPAPSTAATASTAVETGSIKVGRDPGTPFTVTANDIGIHSYTTQYGVPAKSQRIACLPTWAAAEPAPGKFDWTEFDRVIAQAESWGSTDIMVVMCGTPKWAGTTPPPAAQDPAAFGPGTSQPPKDMDDWRKYVTAVAKRYKGRISTYQTWNEPTSKQFFSGTPQQMAEMTDIASKAIRSVDPQARVISAGVQTHVPQFYADFAIPYWKALAKKGWQVDGLAAHFYPPADGTPQTRFETMTKVLKDLDKLQAPADLPLWDTEVNYNVSLEGGEPAGRITGQRAAAWTAATFLDAWRAGLRRTYWYLWSADYYSFPGIQMRATDPSTAALNLLGLWVIGAQYNGCTETNGAVDCRFTKDGATFRIAYSTGGNADIDLDGPSRVCPVYGGECEQLSGRISVSSTPVRIDPAAS